MTVTQVQTIVLAGPRGFCAGVDRAIDIVELARQVCPPPIYVRKEIVHNRHVVEALRAKGAHFVDELDEVPDNINDKHDIRTEWLDGASRVGVTAGASTPQFLVSEVGGGAGGSPSRCRRSTWWKRTCASGCRGSSRMSRRQQGRRCRRAAVCASARSRPCISF